MLITSSQVNKIGHIVVAQIVRKTAAPYVHCKIFCCVTIWVWNFWWLHVGIRSFCSSYFKRHKSLQHAFFKKVEIACLQPGIFTDSVSKSANSWPQESKSNGGHQLLKKSLHADDPKWHRLFHIGSDHDRCNKVYCRKFNWNSSWDGRVEREVPRHLQKTICLGWQVPQVDWTLFRVRLVWHAFVWNSSSSGKWARDCVISALLRMRFLEDRLNSGSQVGSKVLFIAIF